MSSAAEVAADIYIRAWCERDVELRRKLVEECFASNGRMVTGLRDIVGREALLSSMADFHARNPQAAVRRLSAIDTRGSMFRFRGTVDNPDGTSVESYDVGQIDDSGRISVILTFPGPLRDEDG